MPTIKYLEIKITPEYEILPSRRVAAHVAIQVVTLEGEVTEIREIIPDNDFMSRFEWLFDRAKRAILDRLRK